MIDNQSVNHFSSKKVMDIRTALLEAIEYAKTGGEGSKLEGFLMMTDSIVGVLKTSLYHEVHMSPDLSDDHRQVIVWEFFLYVRQILISIFLGHKAF